MAIFPCMQAYAGRNQALRRDPGEANAGKSAEMGKNEPIFADFAANYADFRNCTSYVVGEGVAIWATLNEKGPLNVG